FGRFVFDLLGRDGAAVAPLWAEVDAGRGFDLGDKLAQMREQFGFVSGKSSHADRLATIRTVDAEDQVVVDTHTADGIKVAREVRLPGETIVCLETALPAKFADTIREALNRDAPRPAGFEGLEDLPQKVTVFDADADAVKAYVRQALS
ncbi:MAG: threonine synthase, partial [Vogesella sp.]|nr:threonine synthase [Vogesella sp.]